MGFTGLIFGAIAAAWLIYLVPFFLRHRGEALDSDVDAATGFTPAVTIVRSGGSLAEADPGSADVSTPLTRRAQLGELKLLDAQAAQRRRRVLIFLLLVQVLVAALAAFGVGAWWGAAIPFGLILAFAVVSRFSVRAMRADLARRAAEITEVPTDETIALSLTERDAASRGHSIELTGAITPAGSLWDPVPITRPTYVSTPLAPRTVRTIDLSFPAAPLTAPVTADPITPPAEARQDPDAAAEVG